MLQTVPLLDDAQAKIFLQSQKNIQRRFISVTRLGDLLDFGGQLLKPLATIYLPKSPTFLGIFVKVLKHFIFLMKSFLGNFYRHLAIFYGHTDNNSPCINYAPSFHAISPQIL